MSNQTNANQNIKYTDVDIKKQQDRLDVIDSDYISEVVPTIFDIGPDSITVNVLYSKYKNLVTLRINAGSVVLSANALLWVSQTPIPAAYDGIGSSLIRTKDSNQQWGVVSINIIIIIQKAVDPIAIFTAGADRGWNQFSFSYVAS